MITLARQHFFDKIVKKDAWKNSMSGENEEAVIATIENIGYKLNEDFVRQHPIGERFVIDIAFVKEQVAIEVDGTSHESRKQKLLDKKRDTYLSSINWVPIRIKDSEFFGYKKSFYKNLIKEIVEERKEQWSKGALYPIDFINYDEKNYE